jgi:hypothetical protein
VPPFGYVLGPAHTGATELVAVRKNAEWLDLAVGDGAVE